MTKFLSFSSGSSGNCYYIGNDDISLLIDMGVSSRSLVKSFKSFDLNINNLAMILVTHDHMDHIKFLGPAAKKFSVPVYATAKVHKAMTTHPCTKGYLEGCKRVVKINTLVENRGIKFVPFYVPHDATETVGYYIDFFSHRFVFITDCGAITPEAINYCRQAENIIIESNYDSQMLKTGPYPAMLKKRIVSGYGHLSNLECGEVLKKIYHKGLNNIFLCHLSGVNNMPDLAYEHSKKALSEIGVKVGQNVNLSCLPRRTPSEILYLDK
ncbi:MAG: MBL fold metallo-hydrolase [Bacteroidales bacterium]